jgi:hypothetical protein
VQSLQGAHKSAQSPCRVHKESTQTPQTQSKKKRTESVWTPLTSTAALYTTETHIQHIQGSHKTMPFTDRPTHSADARSFRRSYIVAWRSSSRQMRFAVVVDVEVVKNSKLKNSNPLSRRSTMWHPITQPQPRDHRNPIRRIQQNPQVHPSASAKITLRHQHSLIGVGTVIHSHILLWHSYPLSTDTLRYPHQYISTPNTLILANNFSH